MNFGKKIKITVFACVWLSSILAETNPVKSQETENLSNRTLSFEAPFSASGYKKALDMCMQVWGDVCVLRDHQEINAERALLVDVVAGRLVYLEAAVSEMLAHEAVTKPKDADITYLNNLVTRLENCCDQLVAWDSSERVKCFKPIVHNIKMKLVAK